MLYINYFFPRVMIQSVGSVVHLSARKRSFVSVVGPEKGRSFCADLVFFVFCGIGNGVCITKTSV